MNYVLIYAENITTGQFVIVEKQKPDWQKNKLNLIGGKIEEGETPQQAAVRELKEETGLFPYRSGVSLHLEPIVQMGKIIGNFETIYCFKTIVSNLEIKKGEGEVEDFFWINWEDAQLRSNLLPNLKLIIPLCKTNVMGWTLDYSDDKFKHNDAFVFVSN